ncbi:MULTISPECIES: cell division ATP-binding protein FtsE [Persicobacter]|uniref:Cell division ATP-binding protein FtsE n=1 Tax=Persicobacter diffluens TaxID=981 RepID=A0AAN4VYW3_9BACT|nr:ATP-binding cassette domain-containing protein [Persicobacter sp. CCB-QB2]GJM61606.1 phosphonate ABC transporter ATP-binding protein [Persicobacter diffluens]
MSAFSDLPVVALENARISVETRTVLTSASFNIGKGEFVYLVGRTGSGKSSLLRTIYADLELEEGKATVAGFTINGIKRKDVPMLRRKLGIIFQDFQLFKDRTVSENLEFVLKATGWTDSGKIKSRITDVLMKVGLTGHLSKMPHQLSGGEQQRVVIARALLNEPQILIADEPTGNLDPEVTEGIYELLDKINSQGTAILMATHDYSLIDKHPHRILKIENGAILDSEKEKIQLIAIY